MDERRLRLDPFAFALGALALLTLGFIGASNGGALVMCGLCFAGLLAARFVGFSNLALVPLAGGLVILLWMLWVDPPLDSHSTGAIAHAVGGLLVGWAVAEFLRGRADWPMWAIGAVGGVLALTIAWELGEWVADRALTTDLMLSKRDSAIDIAFGTLGGAAGTLLVTLLPERSPR